MWKFWLREILQQLVGQGGSVAGRVYCSIAKRTPAAHAFALASCPAFCPPPPGLPLEAAMLGVRARASGPAASVLEKDLG